MKKKHSKKYYYFRKQRIMGLVIVAIGILSGMIDGDITAAILLVPLGLYSAFTKDMWLLNDYFYEVNNKRI